MNRVSLFLRMKLWQLWLCSVSLSVLLSEAVIIGMAFWLKGYVPYDYLLTGLVTSCLVSALVVALLSAVLEKFQQSQQQLHIIIETVPECVTLFNMDGAVQQINRAGLKMLEANSSEQLGLRQLQQQVLPDYQNEFAAFMQQAFAGTAANLKFELQGLKGTRRWVNTHAAPVRDTQGQINALLTVTRDITSQHQAEQKLQESERKFRHLVEKAPLPLCLVNNDHEIEFINQRFSELFGYTLSEIGTIEGCWWQMFPEETYRQKAGLLWWGAVIKAIHQNTDIGPLEYEVTSKDGTVRTMLISGIVFTSGFLVIFTDITEHKRSQNEILATKNQLQATLDAIPDPLFEIDADGYFYNYHSPHQKLLIAPAEFIGKTVADVLPAQATAVVMSALTEAKQKGWSLGKHFQLVNADGEFWFELSVSIKQVDARQKPHFIVLSHDITAAKQLEESLQRSESKFRALYDSTSDAVMLLDEKGFFDCNQATLSLFGCPTVAEFCRKHPAELSPPQQPCGTDSKVLAQQRISSALAQGGLRFEWLHKRLDTGQCFPAEVLLSAMMLDNKPVLQSTVRDIAERKTIEEVLKASEARFRLILDISPIPQVLNDEYQNITFLNPAFIKTFGYDLNDIPTLHDWWKKACPDSKYRLWVANSWQAELAEVIRENKNFTPLELTIRCKDGSQKIVLASEASFSQSFNPVYIIVLYDITERKRNEQELANNKRFKALIEAIPDAIFLKDGHSRWLITNEAAKQLFQLHEIPWQGKTEMELAALQPELRTVHKMCLADDEKTWATGKLTLFSETLYNKNGQKLDFEVRKNPIFDEYGQRQALVIIGRDITERKQMEEQLRKLALAVEQSPESIMITNLDIEIEYVNEAFLQSTGYTRAEVIGQNPRILQSGKTPAQIYLNMWTTLSEGRPWKGEFINQRKDGYEYVEIAIITPLRQANGTVSHYVAVKEDITEKKRLAEELNHHRHHLEELVGHRTRELMIAKAQAEAANQAKSEFLANMSHEIRTPMNAILGFSSILADLITEPVQLHYLDAIKTSGKTLLQLINDVLDLSKIEAGKLELNYSAVALKAIFEDIATIFRQKLAEKGISFNFEIAENVPPCLFVDEIRLRQILLNLIGNAVKFTEHGFIHASVSRRATDSENRLDLIITISDSGMGIAEDQQDSIFLAFTQQKHQNCSYGGTGLGLAICKRLIEIMGGTISVSSALGQGSCFTLILPDVEMGNQPKLPLIKAAELPPKAVHFQPAQLLVVDDIEFNRRLITSMLQAYPELKLLEADSGEQALQLLQQQQFDLIFMDKRLPGIDGDSVCETIRTLPGYAEIPIIMITASALLLPEEHSAPSYNVRLNKPVNKAELLNAMQAFLRIDESAALIPEPFISQVPAVFAKPTTPAENLPALLALLSSCYQVAIAKQQASGILEIDTLIDIAKQLIEIAEQYHCSSLYDWANTLKNQTELFDLTELPKTLSNFQTLLEQLAVQHHIV